MDKGAAVSRFLNLAVRDPKSEPTGVVSAMTSEASPVRTQASPSMAPCPPTNSAADVTIRDQIVTADSRPVLLLRLRLPDGRSGVGPSGVVE